MNLPNQIKLHSQNILQIVYLMIEHSKLSNL